MEPFDLPPGERPEPEWRRKVEGGRRYKGAALGLPADGPGSLASIGQRFVGALLDGLVLLPLAILSFLLRNPHLSSTVDPVTGRTTQQLVTDLQPVWMSALITLVGAIYVIGLIGWRGRTVGEAVVRIKVIRLSDRQIPGYDVAARRWLVVGAISIVSLAVRSFAPPGAAAIELALQALDVLVLAWAIWDPNRQGLHDRFAGTIVVRDGMSFSPT